MQNVAWAITRVMRPRPMPTWWNPAFSEIPVTMPGSAIGSTTSNDTVLRPKNANRWTANDSADPSTTAMSEARVAVFTEVQSASVGKPPWANAFVHQLSVKPVGGHENDRAVLNDSTAITINGAYRKATPRPATTRRAARAGRDRNIRGSPARPTGAR